MACDPYNQYLGTCPTWWEENGSTVINIIWMVIAVAGIAILAWAITRRKEQQSLPNVPKAAEAPPNVPQAATEHQSVANVRAPQQAPRPSGKRVLLTIGVLALLGIAILAAANAETVHKWFIPDPKVEFSLDPAAKTATVLSADPGIKITDLAIPAFTCGDLEDLDHDGNLSPGDVVHCQEGGYVEHMPSGARWRFHYS